MQRITVKQLKENGIIPNPNQSPIWNYCNLCGDYKHHSPHSTIDGFWTYYVCNDCKTADMRFSETK